MDTLGHNGDMESGIYQIQNQINGKRYIGSAVNLQCRWRHHLRRLGRGQHDNQNLQRAFNKYGESVFVFSVVEYTEVNSLIEREQHYLDTRKPEYNIALIAGSQLGYRHSLEARRKMSEVNRGECNPNHGKSRSAETRRKIGEAQRGERNHMYGRHHSNEERAKLSAAQRGRRRSAETCANISAAKMGHPVSEETRAKLRAARRGRIIRDETRVRLSAALKAYWRRVHALSGEVRKI